MKNKPALIGTIALDALDGGLTVREIVFQNVIPDDLQPVKVRLDGFDSEKQSFRGVASCVSIPVTGRAPDEIRRFATENSLIEVIDIPVEVTIEWLSKLIARFRLEVRDGAISDCHLEQVDSISG